MADCLFCSIIAGTTPAQIVLDTPDVVGFLDIRPVFKGHTLIVPRAHVPTMVEMSDEVMVPLFGAARSTQIGLVLHHGSEAVSRQRLQVEGEFVGVRLAQYPIVDQSP